MIDDPPFEMNGVRGEILLGTVAGYYFKNDCRHLNPFFFS